MGTIEGLRDDRTGTRATSVLCIHSGEECCRHCSGAAKPRLEMGTGNIPLKLRGDNNMLYSFSLKVDDHGKDWALRVKAFDICHCRMGHTSARRLDILNKVEGHGVRCC